MMRMMHLTDERDATQTLKVMRVMPNFVLMNLQLIYIYIHGCNLLLLQHVSPGIRVRILLGPALDGSQAAIMPPTTQFNFREPTPVTMCKLHAIKMPKKEIFELLFSLTLPTSSIV